MKEIETKLKSNLLKGLDGDDGAYRQFLIDLRASLRPFLQRQLFRLRQHQLDVDDAVQEVILSVHRKSHTYDRETPVTAWIAAIARYKIIDLMRRSSTHDFHVPIEDVERVLEASSPDIEQRLVVRSALERLPAKLKRALELVKLHGFSIREAALETGSTEAAVKVNVHRAARAMKDLLSP